MTDPIFCGKCKHKRFDDGFSYSYYCQPGPSIERDWYGWHHMVFRCEKQNAINNCSWYKPNRRERLRRWWAARRGE